VHGLLSSQFKTPAPGWQKPPPHASPVVQGLPSEQGAALMVWKQPWIGSQESSVQTLLSLQLLAAPG